MKFSALLAYVGLMHEETLLRVNGSIQYICLVAISLDSSNYRNISLGCSALHKNWHHPLWVSVTIKEATLNF